ncbi:homeobox protein OTX1-like [Chionomys nivalis]|uniref:homeobox protein OTX1-like n=1 Tax=Chionomys nivalis TaxID=269649 RepID=UPI002596BF4F|nr:homeobox protein OTX1-like [Chionomys nivalis]
METVFQETQYPDGLTRAVLARNMDAPEAKVQAWFNNRRAKQRAREKKAMLRSAPRAEAPMVLPTGEGRNEEESGSGQPGSRAPTAELGGVEELRRMGQSGESPSVAVASGLTDDRNQEGTSHISQEREHSPQKPVPESIRDPEAVQPVPSTCVVHCAPGTTYACHCAPRTACAHFSTPRRAYANHWAPGSAYACSCASYTAYANPCAPDVDIHPVPVLVPHRRLHDRFTRLQLQELERVFRRNPYLNADEGKQLARRMSVTEGKLHRWFKRRREQFWRG